MAEIFTGAFWAEYGAILAEGVLDTLIMTAASTDRKSTRLNSSHIH